MRPYILRARLVGRKAKSLLAGPDFSGKIFAVLSTTIYLLGGDGEILWLALEGLPVHRRCLLTSFQPGFLRIGQAFWVQNNCLRIGRRITIQLDRVTEWEPRAAGPEQAEPLRTVNACFQELLASLPVPDKGAGLGPAIPLISAIAAGRGMTTFRADSLVARASVPIGDMARACLGQDIAQVARKGRELVGLGPGLTPSGDDFLGGLLFAVHFLKIAYPGDFPGHQEPIVDLIEWAGTQTHPISHTILGDLALGHGPEPLHDVITALLTGEDLSRPTVGVARLVEIGHNSGWDILAGLLTGMLLVEGKIKSKNQNPSNSLAL